jgi:hypothetical protein
LGVAAVSRGQVQQHQLQEEKIDTLPVSAVSGRVVNGMNGKPLPGAQVSLEWISQPCMDQLLLDKQELPCGLTRRFDPVTTDKAGRFLFARVPKGWLTISAKEDGLVEEIMWHRRPMDSCCKYLRVADSEEMELQLFPMSRLSGVLRDEAGHGVGGWVLSAWRVGAAFGVPSVEGEGVQLETAQDGSFHFDRLRPGKYTLIATAQTVPPGPEGERRVPVSVLRPADLTPGENPPMMITVKSKGAFRVAGAMSHEGERVCVPVEPTVMPTARVKQPGEGPQPKIDPATFPISVVLIRKDAERLSPETYLSTRGLGGKPTCVERIVSGSYTVVVRPPSGMYAASVIADGVDLANDPYVLRDSGDIAAIKVALRDDVGVVYGVVSSGGRPKPAFVYAIPLFATTSDSLMVVSLEDGGYQFFGLAPGAYRMVATEYAEEIPWRDAKAMEPWMRYGQVITVTPNERGKVDLQMERVEPADSAERR